MRHDDECVSVFDLRLLDVGQPLGASVAYITTGATTDNTGPIFYYGYYRCRLALDKLSQSLRLFFIFLKLEQYPNNDVLVDSVS